ncbi:MAG: alpha/beta fold hydrolase [Planctomycetaceae bacterium]
MPTCPLRFCLALLIANTAFAQTQIGSHQDLTWYTDADGSLKTISTTADWQRRRASILAGMERAMGPLPDRSSPPELDMRTVEEKPGDGFLRRTITFASADGDRIFADLYLPNSAASDNRQPAMLALHPTGAPGKRIIGGDTPRLNRQYATELAQRGYVVIAPDYPSFGDAADYDFSTDDYVSGTMKGIANHMRCVDLLQTLNMVDGDRIGVIGHSLGGHNAMFVGVFDQRLKVIVSSCGWTPFHDYYAGNITGWTSDRYMPRLRDEFGLDPNRVPFDFYEVIAALAPRAFFSSSPVHDDNFDVAGVKKAIPKAAEVYRRFDAESQLQVRYPECDHDFPTETRADAYRFIDSVLNHTPTSDIDYASELPRIPPTSPVDALKTFQLADGFGIEQTAAEPLVTDPVAMSFDADSRLYVAEMKDYSEQENDFLGQIRLLEDTDGDGRFDTSHIFADGFSWPTAIICYDGGVFVGAPPDMHFLRDTDGDGRADEKRTVLTGFGRGNVQGLLNSLRWGLDNRIHGAASSAAGSVRRPDQPESSGVDLRGHDFSFDPRTFDIRAESGGAQHGMCFDDWGRKFVCSNSDHAQMVVYDERYTSRNPSLSARPPRISIADDGGQAPVYRTSPVEPWRIVRTRLRVSGQVRGPIEGGGRAAGYFTGATGITIYRGNAYPPDMRGTAFIADVGSNIVHRKKLIPNGVTFTATRIDEGREFLSSTDVWFRPVQFANAPDGCLHILDMCRETIEHPASLPPEIKQHLDLTSGRDRGRLYRIVPDGFHAGPLPKLQGLPSRELAALLNHRNGWHRDTAARLLFERQDTGVIPQLVELVRTGDLPEGRIHAMYVLNGLSGTPRSSTSLDAATVLAALHDPHPRVREHAVRLTEPFAQSASIRAELAERITDSDSRVRFQLGLSVGEFSTEFRDNIVRQLLKRDAADPWIVMAALSSLTSNSAPMLTSLLSDAEFMNSTPASAVIGELASLVVSQSGDSDIAMIAAWITDASENDAARTADVLRTLMLHAPALTNRLRVVDGVHSQISAVVANARDTVTANGDESPLVDRITAVRVLAAVHEPSDAVGVAGLLEARVPEELQTAALTALSAYSSVDVAPHIIDRWPTLTPALQRSAEELLFSREPWVTQTLDAIAAGKMKASDISVARWSMLTSHRDDSIRATALRLQQASGQSNRSEIVERYQAALQLAGDPERGRTVFRKTCAACHRVEEHGHEIGPNLATIRNRGREAILLNVLDPNREVNPQFTNYVAVTNDGLTHTGMIANESSTVVTLRRAEDQTSTLLRRDIDDFRNTGQSLMPEGVEKDIDVEAMADLLSYLLKP